ncbi:MAG: hypothetical protein HQ518_30345 [Rhodopirellula sp.]|nr:hypothetical protein [Rhodopirellula sp.]
MIEELLRKGILSLVGVSVLAGIYLVQRFLLFLARRVLPVREAEIQSACELKSKKHRTFGLRIKRVLICSLAGMFLGAVVGLAVFWIGIECWDYVAQRSSPNVAARTGGDPIDQWAKGIVRLMSLLIVMAPFVIAGLRTGIRLATSDVYVTARSTQNAE